ncbi:unnamed protein product [Kuraishia capsulata CBS 1993]|uniref:Uncharacterized protein n=1 Tax=Kuraishia capsulata CBS 1993 TaxID=1382522 RepID=W6MRN9_9ASCO|nr:uncharacterized protein KUCA_T00004994001 [Kuraishia capsulata CBS 1993]CDK29008.1 unnamed protein product [Kuraishia capsulata CBS 1993]
MKLRLYWSNTVLCMLNASKVLKYCNYRVWGKYILEGRSARRALSLTWRPERAAPAEAVLSIVILVCLLDLCEMIKAGKRHLFKRKCNWKHVKWSRSGVNSGKMVLPWYDVTHRQMH